MSGAQFTTGQLLEAADVTGSALQSWIKRGLLVSHRKGAEITGGGSQGVHRRFSYRAVMVVATASCLIKQGVGAECALAEAERIIASGRGGTHAVVAIDVDAVTERVQQALHNQAKAVAAASQKPAESLSQAASSPS